MARFVIAGQFFFPQGGAPGSRVRNLALGLAEAGAQVDVIGAALRGADVPLGSIVEIAPGVRFHAPLDPRGAFAETRLRNETLGARIGWLLRELRRFRDVRKRLRRLCLKSDDVVVLYGRSFLRLAPLFRDARGSGAVIVWDVVEAWTGFRGFGGRLNPLYWDGRRSVALTRQADLVTTITTGLASMFRESRTHLLPTLLSWADSPPGNVGGPSSGVFRVLYIGGLLAKDDPLTLFAAVRIARERGHAIQLVVAGHIGGSREGRAWRTRVLADPALSGVVEFHESPDDAALAQLRLTADAFVTLRPDTPAEALSFPTRVVEHLQHARPLVTTALGDLPLYLRNAEDALLVAAGDATGVADAFARLASDRAFARELGTRGWHAGRQHFDRVRHARSLMQALDSGMLRETPA